MKGITYEYFDLRNYIQAKSAYKNLPQKLKAPPEMVLDSYRHITFVVESVSEYLQVLQIIKRNDRFSDPTYAFRGMSDYTFNMLPSIARKSVLSLAKVENRMVNEFLTLRPGEFSGITSNFDLLAKMQHFGLPTRLLDFSLNPLIALYFACVDNPQKIARVVCTNYTFHTKLSGFIERICGMYEFDDMAQVMVEDVFKGINHLWRYALYSPFPFMKKPPYFDDRIKNQEAVFMVFSNKLHDRIGKAAYWETQLENREDINYGFEISAQERNQIDFVKQYENFEDIYLWRKVSKELKKFYPANKIMDFTATLQSIFQQYSLYRNLDIINYDGEVQSDNIPNPLLRRYEVMDEIQPIEDFAIQHYFCSVLIKAKHKKKIVDELDSININEKFVYPELEYTAKHIKQKYFR